MSTSSSDGKPPSGGGVANVFQRAIESRPGVATPAREEGERVDVPTCPNCGAPRERDQETCRYCDERM